MFKLYMMYKDRYVLATSVADPWHYDVNPDPRIHASDKWIRIWILLFSSLTFKTPKKTNFLSFSAYYFLKVHLQHFSKIKSKKKSQNNRNEGISCLVIEGSGSGARSTPLTNGFGSGSRNPKNMPYGSDGSRFGSQHC